MHTYTGLTGLSGVSGMVGGAAVDRFFAASGATYPWYTNSHPSAAYDASTGVTWFAWESYDLATTERLVKVRTYDHTAGVWGATCRVAVSPLNNDDHGVPAICRDHQGYWHAFFGAHVGALHHSVTASPDDPSAWLARPNVTTTNGVTYPHPVLVGSTLYLFLRDFDGGTGPDSPLIMFQTTALSGGVETWSAKIPIADYGADSRFYQGTTVAVGTKIHFVSTRANSADSFRRDIHYLVYNTATGAVENWDDSVSTASGSLPLLLATLDASYKIHTHAGGTGGTIPPLCFDFAGNPHVLYSEGVLPGTSFPVFHLTPSAGVWGTPTQIGACPSKDSEFALAPAAGGGVAAYWPQTNAIASLNGGDLWTATRPSGGPWGASALLQSAPAVPVNEPMMVRSGHANARAAWTEVVNDASAPTGTLKMWAYGDSGYLSRATGTGYQSWLPRVSDTVPLWAANFATGKYWYGDASYSSYLDWFHDTRAALTRASSNMGYCWNASGVLGDVQAGQPGGSYFPRFDYDPVTHAAKGLLIEGTASTVTVQSEQLNTWSAGGASVSANATPSPDGATTADKIVENSVTSLHGIFQQFTGTAASHIVSGYFKSSGRSWVRLGATTGVNAGVWFDLSGGVVGSSDAGFSGATITDVGGGWYWCRVPMTLTASASWYVTADLGSANNTPSYVGNGTSGLYGWGVEVKAASYPSSYIKTVGAVATRGAESYVRARTGPTVLTKVISARTPLGAGTQVLWQADDGTESNRVRVHRAGDNHVHVVVTAAGVSQADLDLGAVSHDTAFKVAFRARANDFSASLNGGAASLDTSGTMPEGLTTERWGADSAGNQWNGWLASDAEFASALTDANLVTLSL